MPQQLVIGRYAEQCVRGPERYSPHRCGGAKSFVDDLVLGRGVVLSRAATSLRSIETQPWTRRFVCVCTDRRTSSNFSCLVWGLGVLWVSGPFACFLTICKGCCHLQFDIRMCWRKGCCHLYFEIFISVKAVVICNHHRDAEPITLARSPGAIANKKPPVLTDCKGSCHMHRGFPSPRLLLYLYFKKN